MEQHAPKENLMDSLVWPWSPNSTWKVETLKEKKEREDGEMGKGQNISNSIENKGRTGVKKEILVYGLEERVKCIIFIEEGRYFFWIKMKAPARQWDFVLDIWSKLN